MRRALAFALSIGAVAAPVAAAPPATFSAPVQSDVLTRMFVWWNGAFKDPQGFTADAFGRYFTADGAMRINGTERARGLPALAARFRMIQAHAQAVEIKLPFAQAFSSPDGTKIFTYHLIDAVEGGKPGHEMVMGYATLRDGKIALIDFLSVEGQPGPFTR
ncbi:hypothetical protein [Sphingomonas nostoxanthinifaciens]|uniref:hypothetical protein n=1 Tax=Sphingomonas nostoxanthinifaciens TaxID=2872652 RepID=UPI001CC1E3EC|nr:hypothetical protein [Sphingomonas nostoxanthinifaciens]UAK22908.1 hypothetical protein K8P63_10710 [Sphingomonas nostoxanthinifaciens]